MKIPDRKDSRRATAASTMALRTEKVNHIKEGEVIRPLAMAFSFSNPLKYEPWIILSYRPCEIRL